MWTEATSSSGGLQEQLWGTKTCSSITLRTTGQESLTFRYWFFFSNRVKSFNLSSQSLPSWKMSAILFFRARFQLDGVCIVWNVCSTSANNLLPGCKFRTWSALPKKQTWNKTVPQAPPTLWLHGALKRKWQPGEPTCRVFYRRIEDIVCLLSVPWECLAHYNAVQHIC